MLIFGVTSVSAASVQIGAIMADYEHVTQDHRQQFRSAW